MDTQASKISTVEYQVAQELSQHVFRAYDIRGIIESELTADVFYTLGLAIGSLMVEKNQTKVLLGFDARLSSEGFALALCKGLQATGIDVSSVGMVPSPVLYFALNHTGIKSGLMVTGSHNPQEYNGLKIVIDGKNLANQEITDLYQRITERRFHVGSGTYQAKPIIESYINAVSSQIKLAWPLKVAIDCGNAIAGKMAADLYRRIGAEVLELYCDVDGRFPNHHPDPSVEENLEDLKALVQRENCDIGLAFDGDADRLGVVTAEGKVIWPDRQLMLLAKSILKHNQGATIVYDVKCSALLKDVIEQAGGKPLMCPTGHSIVKRVMHETKAALAGEMSGHLFIKDNWNGFDDALYSGARLLDALTDSELSISEQFAELPEAVSTVELKVLVREDNKFQLMQQIVSTWQFEEGEKVLIDGLRWQADYGWGLVRASNTSPYLIVRFEADTETALVHIQNLFRHRFLALDPSLDLPF